MSTQGFWLIHNLSINNWRILFVTIKPHALQRYSPGIHVFGHFELESEMIRFSLHKWNSNQKTFSKEVVKHTHTHVVRYFISNSCELANMRLCQFGHFHSRWHQEFCADQDWGHHIIVNLHPLKNDRLEAKNEGFGSDEFPFQTGDFQLPSWFSRV